MDLLTALLAFDEDNQSPGQSINIVRGEDRWQVSISRGANRSVFNIAIKPRLDDALLSALKESLGHKTGLQKFEETGAYTQELADAFSEEQFAGPIDDGMDMI